MKIKEKLLILVIGLSAILTITSPIKSNAALQANGNTSKTDTITNWLLNIRKMEETGGTLGLSDTIDTTNLLSTAEKSNNLDIHMEKNTEYGAMAILSASAYGNQNKIANGGTTTGNKSGVYMKINAEWVSAGTISNDTQYTNANRKYKNLYTTTYVAKAGDAIGDVQVKNSSGTVTGTWHNGTSQWIDPVHSSGLLRAYSGSIFSYYGYSGRNNNGDAASYRSWSTRAVIVVGNGF